MTPSDPRIDVRNVSKAFAALTAVDDVSFTLEGAGITGLVGQNGAGKSTLLSLLSGTLRPTRGHIEVLGVNVSHKAPAALARQGVRRLFQEVRLVPELRVWENIAVGYDARVRPSRSKLLSDVYRCAESVGLSPHALDAWPSEMPIGAQRRVELARLLIAEPTVAFIDEPTANLTLAESSDVADVISGLAKSALVVLVEHNMRLVYSIGSRVIVLMQGRVVADGEPSVVARDPLVREAYLGQPADA